jgi:type VI secretion system protein
MRAGLLEVLTGRYLDGTRLEDVAEEDREVMSIRDHLSRLMNSRADALVHIPTHGMPDIPSLFQRLPYSLDTLAETAEYLVRVFEPRLHHPHVTASELDTGPGYIRMLIQGVTARGEMVSFSAWLRSEGMVRVSRERS